MKIALISHAGIQFERIEPAGEVAAAILNGAHTAEDVSVMTGARTGCAMWCLAPVLRLLKAHNPELSIPKDGRWHDTELSLWNIPDTVAEKYSGYCIKEDKELADHGITGALLSGKIAAMAVMDPEKGQKAFGGFTKGMAAHISRKKKPGYKPEVHFGDVWFDIK